DGRRSVNIQVWISYEVRARWWGEVPVRSDTICAQRDTRSRAKLRDVQHRLCHAVLGNYKLGRRVAGNTRMTVRAVRCSPPQGGERPPGFVVRRAITKFVIVLAVGLLVAP